MSLNCAHEPRLQNSHPRSACLFLWCRAEARDAEVYDSTLHFAPPGIVGALRAFATCADLCHTNPKLDQGLGHQKVIGNLSHGVACG